MAAVCHPLAVKPSKDALFGSGVIQMKRLHVELPGEIQDRALADFVWLRLKPIARLEIFEVKAAHRTEGRGKCQRGELNSRPTPKAFGAALTWMIFQMEYCELRILLSLQRAFKFPRFEQGFDLSARHNLQVSTEALRCCGVAATVLSESRFEVNRGSDVVATVRASENINPSHFMKVPEGRVELPTKGL